MASTRSYDFLTGPQTSTAPTAGTPTTDNDFVSKGYADDTYAELQYWGDPVADTTALKAVGASDRFDKQIRLKDDNQTLWKFDSGSSATEDGSTVIQPTSGTGRWLISSGTGGGSGGSASAIEALEVQNDLLSQGFYSKPMDNSLRASGLDVPVHTYFTGYLIENYTSGGSSIKVVWNPVVLNDSDKDYDSTTGYTATGAGASLSATAGSNKVGSNKFTFDKNGTATEAGVRYDRGSQNLNVGSNYRVWFWINLPSITNLSNVGLRIYADTTSNYRTFTKTTDYAGNALAVGWNLIFVDVSTGGSATGSGWLSTQLSRYQEIFVTTSSSGQTYSSILLDGIWFSHGDIAGWAPKYLEFTGADTSNKNDFKIDSATTFQDGVVSLASTVAQNYTAGISVAAAAKFYRSSLSWSQSGLIGFNSSLTSGTIATEEEMRITRILRESLSANYGAYVDLYTPQIYKVTAVGGSTIDVADSENHSANLLNGDSIHIFTTTYSAGEPNFTLLATRSLTAGASHSTGTTTLTLTTSGIAVGDYVVKQHLSTSISVVSASANESFSAMSYDTSPNGAQLIGSRSYLYPSKVYSHWWLGGTSEAIAKRDQTGNGRDLVKPSSGTPSFSETFKNGKFAYSNTSTAPQYFRTASSTVQNYDGIGESIQISLWVYITATSGSARALVATRTQNAGNFRGWALYNQSSGTTVSLDIFDNAGSASATISTGSLGTGTWNHIFLRVKSADHQIYLNGASAATSAYSHSVAADVAQSLYFGILSNDTVNDSNLNTAMGTDIKIADCIVWRDAATFSLAEIQSLYNGGVPQWIGYNPAIVRNEYAVTGQSGQRLSMKTKLNRSTTAVSPYILNAGVIKTG